MQFDKSLRSLAIVSMAVVAPIALQASAPAPHYVAELVRPTSESQAIAGGVMFRCEGTRCTGPRSGHRPLRVCSQLQREVGEIASFRAGDEALSAERLEACNG